MTGLIEEWQSGDMHAFEAIFREYQRLVFRTAYLMTGKKEEAEDVLQEVFLKVWKSRHTFNPERGKLTTWLHKITVNQCLSRQRRRHLPMLSMEQKNFDWPDMKHREQPEEILVTRSEYERLIKAMNSLDSKHRSVLVLRYFSDLSYDEIAHIVDIPLGTVKSRISQALKSVRSQLSNQQPEVST
jgi:RNA polymerase sigma-70 factor (ECF subfamily)